MVLSMNMDPSVTQRFMSEGRKPLESLPTHLEETGDRFVLWSEIQLAFPGIDSLKIEDRRVMFDSNGYNV